MGSVSDRIPVWLDCDPGHDDAFAILLAAYHPAIELLGVSTVHGNSSLAHTTENALSVLTAIGRPDIPVYPGASKPLSREAAHAPRIHGESGLDGTDLLPKPAVTAVTDVPAVDAIASALLAKPPNTSWLIATGTLTNVAHLIHKYPEIVGHLKGLSIMGGAVGDSFTDAPMGRRGDVLQFGNWTPYGEFNIVCDPEAADIVFSNAVLAAKTILIPLDVTHQVLVTPDVQNFLLHGPSKNPTPSTLRIMFGELLQFFSGRYSRVFGLTSGPPLHDPLAVAAILDGLESEVPFYDYKDGQKERKERFKISIPTEGTHAQAQSGETQTGRTVVTLLDQGQEGVKIPRGLDVEHFWQIVEQALQRADEHASSI